MFDDVGFADAKRMAILREFVTTYPKVRYIFSSAKSATEQYGSYANPEMPVRFEFVELCVLRRRDMRQLVAKFNGGTDVDVRFLPPNINWRRKPVPMTAPCQRRFACDILKLSCANRYVPRCPG